MEFNNNQDPEFLKRRAEALKQKAEEAIHGTREFIFKERVNLFGGHDGENIIRILPAGWEGGVHYGIDVWIHYNINANKDSFLCPELHKKGKCYLCEVNAANRGSKEIQDRTKWSHRVLAWLIDRVAEPEGPKMWPMPFKKVANALVLQCDLKHGNYIFIDDVENGRDVIFTKTGKGLSTDYQSVHLNYAGATPLSPDPSTRDTWLQLIRDKNIPSLLQFRDYDYIKKVWEGDYSDRLGPATNGAATASGPMMSEGAAAKMQAVDSRALPPPDTQPQSSPMGTQNSGDIKTQLKRMGRGELEVFIKTNQLELKPEDFPEGELVEAIILEMGIE